MPAVSVVIPAYNAADCIGQAIESVLAQTYADLEILVIDDGSRDNTEHVVEGFGRRVRCLRQGRRGVAAARNLAIRASNARYVAFLDADDLWRSDKLEMQVPHLESDARIGVVCSDWALERSDGAVTPSVLSTRAAVTSGYLFRRIVRDSFLLTSTVVVRRRCLEEAGYFDEAFPTSEDLDLWLRLSHRYRIEVVPLPLTIKRDRGKGLSSDRSTATMYRIKLLQKALTNLPDLLPTDRRLVRKMLAKNYLDLGYDEFSQMAWKQARGPLLSSLKYDWMNGQALGYLAATYLPVPILSAIRTVKRAIA